MCGSRGVRRVIRCSCDVGRGPHLRRKRKTLRATRSTLVILVLFFFPIIHAQYEDCAGDTSSIGNLVCDTENNNPSCGYDGGDCCQCTCIEQSNGDGECGHTNDYGEYGFDCLDPDAADAIYECEEPPPAVAACGADVQQEWVVEETAQASALASAVYCSGGNFEVIWGAGDILVKDTFVLVNGTVLNITGTGPDSALDGDGATRLFTVVNASLHLSNVKVSAGSAVVGGAAAIAIGSEAWFDGVVFSNNNAAPGDGGALHISGSSTVVLSGQVEFSNNGAISDGGAVYVFDDASISTSGDDTIVEFSFNHAENDGGAASFVRGASLSSSEGTTFLCIGNTASRGGALTASDTVTVNLHGTTDFGNNSAQTVGAVFVNGGSTLSSEGKLTFRNNTSKNTGAMEIVGSGSTAAWTGDTFFIENSAFYAAGGLSVEANATASWNGGTTSFVRNTATRGGALYVSSDWWIDGDSSVSWAGNGETSFVENTADYGGALYTEYGASLKWSGPTEFISNHASADGGAMGSAVPDAAGRDSALFIDGVTRFDSNTCGGNGAAMAVQGALEVTFGTGAALEFSNNRAEGSGGAVFISGAGVGLNFVNATFSSNSASVGGGAYVTGSGSTVVIEDNAEVSYPTTFNGCRFVENAATATGGAIDTAAGLDVLIDTVFIGNCAGVGGALRLAGTSRLTNCSFVENTSAEGSGAAVSNIGYISSIEDCWFFDNAFNCWSGTFLDFNSSGDLYDRVCNGCDANCTGCFTEGEVPICTEDIKHSTSMGGNITLELVDIHHGYWRATPTSRKVLPCYNADACNGGVTGAAGYCSQGYEGPYCSVCSDGYSVSMGFTCSTCTSTTVGIVLAAVLGTAAVAGIVTLVLYLLSGKLEGSRRGIVARAVQYIPLQSLKIVVVAWQILTQFSQVSNVTFPDMYQTFLDVVDLVNFDLSWVLSIGCIFDVDFHDRLLLSTIGPLLAMACLGMTYAAAVRKNRASDEAIRNVRHKHLFMVLLVTFLVYSSVSSTLFQMFACERLDDGTNYLRADYRLDCDSARHVALQVYAGFMIMLYTLGIPALYAALLFRIRDVLRDEHRREEDLSVKSTSDLWNPYKSGRYYYEVVECGRRILLAGVVVFIYPNTAAQIAVTLVIAVLFMVASEVLAPYASQWDAWLSRSGHMIVFISFYLALLLKVDVSNERGSSQRVFEGILVAAHVVLVLALVLEALVTAFSVSPASRVRDGLGSRQVTAFRGPGVDSFFAGTAFRSNTTAVI